MDSIWAGGRSWQESVGQAGRVSRATSGVVRIHVLLIFLKYFIHLGVPAFGPCAARP